MSTSKRKDLLHSIRAIHCQLLHQFLLLYIHTIKDLMHSMCYTLTIVASVSVIVYTYNK